MPEINVYAVRRRYASRGTYGLIPVVFVLLLLLSLPTIASGVSPISPVGSAEIVLPGFSPLSMKDRRIALGAERIYDWGNGILPANIRVRGTELIGPMSIVIYEGGSPHTVVLDEFSVVRSSGHHVELAVGGTVTDQLTVTAQIVVEYDGLATVDLLLTPLGKVNIDSAYIVVPVVRTRDLRVLAFAPETIYDYNKQAIYPLCGVVPYKSVLGLDDTERSFWLLTDEPAFPVPANARPATTLLCEKDLVKVVQPLLGAQVLTSPLTLTFAFLATPVKDLPPSVRRDRVVQRLNPQEALLGNRQLWWVEGLPHYALPYVDYPAGAWDRLTPSDRAAYPGLKANRSSVLAWRKLGVEKLPYMSLRAPSGIDPASIPNEQNWRAIPQRTMPATGDGPYKQGIARPLFSHRAPGFSDYMLNRLDDVLAELPVRGFYFDQGAPIGSSNPQHLLMDPRIRPSQATDILAMRSFLKRLATAAYQRGRNPLIYVHNSMATVVPAYTFATAMVQGEEFNHDLKGLNYLSSVDFDTIQATYVSGQFGVPIIWLEEVWSEYLATQRPIRYWRDTAGWLKSPEYEAAWRNFMAVALLHDIPVWTMSLTPLRADLYAKLDRFGVDRSTFTGYWQFGPDWRSRSLLVSLYTRDDGRQLAVIVNRGQTARDLTADDLEPFLGVAAKALLKLVGQRLPPQDFLLAVL